MNRVQDILRDSETIDQQLRMIRRALIRGFEADRGRVDLPASQLQTMMLLTRALREGQDGLTIREMSEKMGLAQSTVSGLVDRLERKHLVQRQVDLSDRRVTRVLLVDRVKTYLDQELPGRRTSILAAALAEASEEERIAILEGVSILYRLIITNSNPPSSE